MFHLLRSELMIYTTKTLAQFDAEDHKEIRQDMGRMLMAITAEGFIQIEDESEKYTLSQGYQNYFSLGKQLQKFGYDICFLLGPGEQENKAEIKQEGFRYLSNLSFREIAALFLIVPGVIGNDTGLMHLACAMGSKSITIAPYGTHFTWFPYAREKHRVCHPECAVVRCRESCLKHTECVRLITLDMILTEAKNLGFINQTIASTE